MDAPIHRIGMTVLHRPDDPENHEVDIVLVHGLFGHPKDTWTSDQPRGWLAGRASDQTHPAQSTYESEQPAGEKLRVKKEGSLHQVFWPRDLLPQVFPQARVLTWGYDVQVEHLLSSSSQASIFHHAETLLSDLAACRDGVSGKKRPIIFVAHSLGGIVVKDALSLSGNERTFFSEILPATIGVIFLGTPHRGSKIASLGKMAFKLSKVFLQKPNLKVLRGVEVNSEVLDRISRSFGQILANGRLKVHSFREELDTKGIRIVEDFSSTIGYPNETRGSLHANHRNMARFSSANNVKFQRVTSVLSRWIEEENELQLPAEAAPTLSPATPRSPDGTVLNEWYQECLKPLDFAEARNRVPGIEAAPTLSPATPRSPDGTVLTERYQECLKSLDFAEARNRVQGIEAAYAETYKWLFGCELGLCDWLAGKSASSIFWIEGKPGSGKSTAMKHLMGHYKTLELLECYHASPWLVAGYFFHDRGTANQKSVEGFLREILYQILCQRKELFSSMYSVFSRVLEANKGGNNSKESNRRISWSISSLEEALTSIGARSNCDVNICLFVDALDEHDGNHRDLLSTLNRLSQLPDNPFFRLRICLAGRPENIFKTAFHTCPGFPIHLFTTNDIRMYAQGRVQQEINSSFAMADEGELQGLIEDIVDKARGVFLWVRLVVDELIEGSSEGDSIEELRDLLSTIPAELEDLYERALRRSPRKSVSASKKQKYEAYVMFQIVVCAIKPFHLEEFLAAASYLTTGNGTHKDLQRLSTDQMERRLNGRSAGLLEAKGRDDQPVQFIHQTVKEYMTNGNGFTVIRDSLGDRVQESGHLLILRYMMNVFENNPEVAVTRDRGSVAYDFSYHGHRLETEQGIAVDSILQETILRLPASKQLLFLDSVDHYIPSRSMPGFLKLRLLKFYLDCNFRISVTNYLERDQSGIAEDICNFLMAFATSDERGYALEILADIRSSTLRVNRVAEPDKGAILDRKIDELVRGALHERDIKDLHKERCLRLWDSAGRQST